MKYMVEYEIRRAGLTQKQVDENSTALLRAFANWRPEEGMTVHAFVGAAEGFRGYALVETDDLKALATFTHRFGAWNDIKIVPVMDVGEVAALAGEMIAWRANTLGGA